jgi:CheY-like chemotaxis protein
MPVELPLVIHESVSTIIPAAAAKGVRIDTSFDPEVGAVSGDRDRLRQVVWNLLANAVKFTPRGGLVHVHLVEADDMVELTVSDSGVGIEADFLPHVFERFRQADSGTKRKNGGVGLGLAIVRHIVEMHGGTVSASSGGEHQGASFVVRLPVLRAHAETTAAPPAPARGPHVHRSLVLKGLDGIRVLAVDDEKDALELLKTVLETAGADVDAVSSPAEALRHLSTSRPHVLLLDLGMPGMDGFELIEQIRASTDHATRSIPAAALTAFARSEDRTKALRSGFEMHLSKPLDPDELVASVATLAGRQPD